jgi:hypothetical protein
MEAEWCSAAHCGSRAADVLASSTPGDAPAQPTIPKPCGRLGAYGLRAGSRSHDSDAKTLTQRTWVAGNDPASPQRSGGWTGPDALANTANNSATQGSLYWDLDHPAVQRHAMRSNWIESRLPVYWNYAGHYLAGAEPVDAAYMRPKLQPSCRAPVVYANPSYSAPVLLDRNCWQTVQFAQNTERNVKGWSTTKSSWNDEARCLPPTGAVPTSVVGSGSKMSWPIWYASPQSWPPQVQACPTVPHPAYWPMGAAHLAGQAARPDGVPALAVPSAAAASPPGNVTDMPSSGSDATLTHADQRMKKPKKKKEERMAYLRFTEEEERLLLEGVALYGIGNWKTILNKMEGFHPKRTPMNLKDKFRNILRARMRQSAGGRMRPNLAPLLIASTCGADAVAAAQKRRKPYEKKTCAQKNCECADSVSPNDHADVLTEPGLGTA